MIGINLGDRDVTTAESDAYLAAVDAASPRVSPASLATSGPGPAAALRDRRRRRAGDDRRPRGASARRPRQLSDPRPGRGRRGGARGRHPAILWIAGNVHGGEESGTDASLQRALRAGRPHRLRGDADPRQRDRRDPADQNPDGREADTRRNAYGFDMNRDWFARTQPETDGKLELLRQYPPVLFIDAHEMGGEHYFFPPNADPIYHEIADQPADWINDLYGAGDQDEFDAAADPVLQLRRLRPLLRWATATRCRPTGFGAAGMTFEKASGDADRRSGCYEQYVDPVDLAVARPRPTSGRSSRAGTQLGRGRRARAAPASSSRTRSQPGTTVQQPVPDIKVRHYFLRADDPAKARESQALVRRLQRMDVEVRPADASR